MGQEFRQRDLDELAADGLLDVDGPVVALPQRRGARGRLPDAHQAGAGPAPRRRRRRAGRARRRRSTTSPTTPPPPPSCSPSSARSTASARRSPTTPSRRCSEAATAALDTGRLDRRHPRTPAGRSTCTGPTRRSSAACCSCGPTAELERRKFAEASADAEEVLESALAAGDRIDEGEARRRLGTCRPDAGRPGDGAARARGGRRAVPGRWATSAAWPTPCGLAGLRRGVRRLARRRPLASSTRRWSIYHRHRRRARATRGPTRTWPGWRSRPATSTTPRCSSREAKERFEALGDANGVIWADGLQAYVLYFQRRFDEAEALAVTVEARRQPLGRHVGRA